MGIGITLLMILYLLIEPHFRSEERQMAVDAKRLQFERQQDESQAKEIRRQALRATRNLVYTKDSRTGLCFASYTYYRYGTLTAVDCKSVPVEMIHVTE